MVKHMRPVLLNMSLASLASAIGRGNQDMDPAFSAAVTQQDCARLRTQSVNASGGGHGFGIFRPSWAEIALTLAALIGRRNPLSFKSLSGSSSAISSTAAQTLPSIRI